MANFVLIHGAWHGGWCWEYVTPLLQAAGHRVFAPDLPGMGSDTTPRTTITLDSWARWLAEYVRRIDEPVVLVGHSRGGFVISQAAEYADGHVARLVYLAAFLAPDGMTLRQLSPGVDQAVMANFLRMEADGTGTLAAEVVGPAFYQRTKPELIARAISKLTPEPMWIFTEPLRLSAEGFGRVPRAYIETAEDNACPIALQRQMQSVLPCSPVITLSTDHSPFYSAPEEVAAALCAVAEAD
jgi:pimeloyl-ACP methyl ester carboxylesterase